MKFNKFFPIVNSSNLLFTFTILLFLISFHSSFSDLFHHGFTWRLMVPFITVYLITFKAKKLTTQPFKPQPIPGLIFLCIAFLFSFSGKVSSTILVSEFAIILGLYALFLYYFGLKAFIYFSGPLSYLLFMSSGFDDIFSIFNPFFRQMSAYTASFLSQLTGHLVLLSSTNIMLPYLTLDVADQCSGINHCISLYALAIPLAIMQLNRYFSIFTLLGLVVPLSILANSFRIFIIILYNYNRHVFTHGPNNILVTGSGFFIGLFFLFIAVVLLSYLNREIKNERSTDSISPKFSFKISKIQQLVLFIFFIITFLFGTFYKVNQIKHIPDYDILISTLSGYNWSCSKTGNFPGIDDFPSSASNICLECSKNGGETIYFYTAYYPVQNNDNEISGYSYEILLNDQKRPNQIKSGVLKSFRFCKPDSDQQILYMVNYRCGSQFTSDPKFTKFHTFFNALKNHSTSASIFITALPDSLLSNVSTGYVQDFVSSVYDAFEKSTK